MSRQPERTLRESKAFCEGVQHEIGGGAAPDNPFDSSEPEMDRAWDDGFRASQGVFVSWAATTAFLQGQITDSGGFLFAAHTPGDTGATAPHLVAPNALGLIEDGDVIWQPQGEGTNIGLGCCGVAPKTDEVPYVPTYV